VGKIMSGWDLLMMTLEDDSMLRSYDAQVIVGEHAMAGTPDGFISHAHSDNTALRINGQYVGEVEWHTWLLGHYGVPTIMVTGDAATIREEKAFFPEIEGVCVKTAKWRDGAQCLPTDKARVAIERTASRVLRGLAMFEPHVPRSPIELDLISTTPEPAKFGSYMPGARQMADTTVSFTARDSLEAVWAHMSLVMRGAIHTSSQDSDRLWRNLPQNDRKALNDAYEEGVRKWAGETSPFADLGLPGRAS